MKQDQMQELECVFFVNGEVFLRSSSVCPLKPCIKVSLQEATESDKQ